MGVTQGFVGGTYHERLASEDVYSQIGTVLNKKRTQGVLVLSNWTSLNVKQTYNKVFENFQLFVE